MRNFLQPNPPQKSPTDAKLNANRQNAQRSTGPRTPEGKKRSSLNATRHGLTGQVHVTTESDRKVYDSHCGEFFQDWQPQGATEKHLVQTVAEKQWQSHRADAELRSVHAVAYAEFADKVDTEHPEVHAALTSGLVALEKSKELELLSRYSSRIQRDLRNALKELRSLQAERKQREQREMHDAAQIAQLCKMKNQSFKPVDFGFVLRREQVETHLLREKYLAEAAIASKFGFNLRKYLAAVAGA